MQQPKPQTYRNKKYLDWIKTKPCVACGAPADDPHHMTVAGTGVRGSDYFTLPCCRAHHDDMQLHRWMILEVKWHFTKADAWRRVAELMQEYLLQKERVT